MASTKGTSKKKNKLKLVWNGPWIVTEVISDKVYKIEDPLGHSKECHVARQTNGRNVGRISLDLQRPTS